MTRLRTSVFMTCLLIGAIVVTAHWPAAAGAR